jgi:hypothetical protein
MQNLKVKIFNFRIFSLFFNEFLSCTGRLRYLVLPYFVPGTTLVLKKKFSNIVQGTKCSQKIFKKFFRSKNKVFVPVQKKQFLNFFLRLLMDFVPVLKVNLEYLLIKNLIFHFTRLVLPSKKN